MADEFRSDASFTPARNAATVTPSDTALTNVSKALYVGGGGDLVVRHVDDDADTTYVGVPAGAILPARVTHVRAASTATNIVNMY